MSDLSNNNGRAYEYVIITQLSSKLTVLNINNTIIRNSSYDACLRAYEQTDDKLKKLLIPSADAAIKKLFDLEANLNLNNSLIELEIQKDDMGEDGDVRDVLIIKKADEWEIGLSIKHNHEAIKHPRLSPKIDFGEKWYGKKCSEEYFKEIKPVFELTNKYKQENMDWKDIPNKEDTIYKPLLKAFMKEIRNAYEEDTAVAKNLVEFLIGEYDFYKVISEDSHKLTTIQAFNMHGKLRVSSIRLIM